MTMNESKAKKWVLLTISLWIIAMAAIAGITIYIDPFFHFHKPVPELRYNLTSDNQRYLTDGILKNFKYDAVIIGTSMTENFKSSEFDNLWQCNSVKVPLPGATYKEIGDNLKRAFTGNENIKYVFCSLDRQWLLASKDHMLYQEELYPTYLYDNNIWNDVKYILNKTVILKNDLATLRYTKDGHETTSFDDYSNWSDLYQYGKDAVLGSYDRQSQKMEKQMTKELKQQVRESINQNITTIARNNPDTVFYYFMTPYSVLWWDSLLRDGTFEQNIAAEKVAIEELLQCKNIKLFSFANNFALITNLDHYKDTSHYSGEVNSQIARWMKTNEYRINKGNYIEYLENIRSFYKNFNYDQYFQ